MSFEGLSVGGWTLYFNGLRTLESGPQSLRIIVLVFLAGNRFFSRHREREREGELFASWIRDTELRFGLVLPHLIQRRKKKNMDGFGGYFEDEKAVRVETIFLDFLKRFVLLLLRYFCFMTIMMMMVANTNWVLLFLCMEWNGSWINESALDLGILLSPITRRRSKQWKPANPPPCSSTSITSCSSTISSKRPFLKNTWGLFIYLFILDSFIHSKT